MATIRQCVDISVLQHVASDTNAFELWHKLSALYERKNALNKTFVMKKIVRLKYVVVLLRSREGNQGGIAEALNQGVREGREETRTQCGTS